MYITDSICRGFLFVKEDERHFMVSNIGFLNKDRIKFSFIKSYYDSSNSKLASVELKFSLFVI